MDMFLINLRWLCVSLLATASILRGNAYDVDEDKCLQQKYNSTCIPGSQCVNLKQLMDALRLGRKDVVHCGYSVYEELICCPQLTVRPRFSERPAERACKEIEKSLQPATGPHIIDGSIVKLGEFPHMAAIGYSRDNTSSNIKFGCGGTLIDKRFVLTAAHCLDNQGDPAYLVRLGQINLNESPFIDVKIEKIYTHDDYRVGKRYHDIGLIKLERDLDLFENVNVFPTCLYTEPNDPKNGELYVTGWGETKKQSISQILLKAQQFIISNDECNARYSAIGRIRKISSGIQSTQLCTHFPDGEKDACQGDSGGPLNLVVNADMNQYRVVGVVSVGIGCGTGMPAVYTRVAAYLDYIESIVWPDEG